MSNYHNESEANSYLVAQYSRREYRSNKGIVCANQSYKITAPKTTPAPIASFTQVVIACILWFVFIVACAVMSGCGGGDPDTTDENVNVEQNTSIPVQGGNKPVFCVEAPLACK